jgi:23S rRNA (uracil1939-C5)-methyltransferase
MENSVLKTGDIIKIPIDNVAFGGEGIGRYNGNFTIFVDNTVPGDEVLVRIGKKKKNYAIGYIEEFVKKSETRIQPKCKHFGLEGDLCGGCSMQFFSYGDQLKIKEQHVKDSITRIGGFDEHVVKPIIGCEPPWFYRNKMEFSFSRFKDGKLNLGLHIKRRHHDLVPLTECFLMNEDVALFVQETRNFFQEKELGGQINGLKSLVVREGKHTGEIMINLLVENLVDDDLKNAFRDFVLDKRPFKGRLRSLFYTLIFNTKGSPKKTVEELVWGENVIKEQLSVNGVTLKFDISPQAFFQPNTFQAEKLFSLALEAAALTGKEVVFDLYCGAGTIALAMASKAKAVYGIELNSSAVINATQNALTNGIKNAIFYEGDVFKKMPDINEKPHVIVVDPPRNGLQEGLTDRIAEFGPERVVYVSCNPTTLARDLALFKKTGYSLLYVQPVDMFPHTYHIENVALLRKL